MTNKLPKKENKKLSLKQWLIVASASVVLGGGAFATTQALKEPWSLTQAQQKSLIETEVEAVNQAKKPIDVEKDLGSRMGKLSKGNKEQAVELIYTSVQRSATYYNNAAYLMSGELDYSTNGKDALSAAKGNSWVGGLISESRSQGLSVYSLNKNTLVMLPNFRQINSKYGNYASGDLKELIQAGQEAQDINVFTGDRVDIVAADKAYSKVIKRFARLLEYGPDTKYLQDMNSLARIYHDAALGLVKTNNFVQDGDYYVFDTKSVDQLKTLAKKSEFLKDDAKDIVSHMDKNGRIKASYIQDLANKSIDQFGTSLYWQSTNDISALSRQGGLLNEEGE